MKFRCLQGLNFVGFAVQARLGQEIELREVVGGGHDTVLYLRFGAANDVFLQGNDGIVLANEGLGFLLIGLVFLQRSRQPLIEGLALGFEVLGLQGHYLAFAAPVAPIERRPDGPEAEEDEGLKTGFEKIEGVRSPEATLGEKFDAGLRF